MLGSLRDDVGQMRPHIRNLTPIALLCYTPQEEKENLQCMQEAAHYSVLAKKRGKDVVIKAKRSVTRKGRLVESEKKLTTTFPFPTEITYLLAILIIGPSFKISESNIALTKLLFLRAFGWVYFDGRVFFTSKFTAVTTKDAKLSNVGRAIFRGIRPPRCEALKVFTVDGFYGRQCTYLVMTYQTPE